MTDMDARVASAFEAGKFAVKFTDPEAVLLRRVARIMREIEAVAAERGAKPSIEARARLAEPYFAKPRRR